MVTNLTTKVETLTKKVKKRGVVIYAKDRLSPKFIFKDDQGRFVAIEIQTQGEKFLIVGIYAPNEGKSDFFKKLHETLMDYLDYNMILMGDMNGVVSTHMDKAQRPWYTRMVDYRKPFLG
ncbi:Hypothetical predicted protein [Podarcis lilfordi]|uniref:Endonuclease/exonuclease/phosphatase domain-containing protein n=1 Tax=Podarcis lilfordi TaxID=74358 RepID=A0AA35KNF7_9SAUR|nr:Hypothetical predicted protein [Podarcis lilfordi]